MGKYFYRKLENNYFFLNPLDSQTSLLINISCFPSGTKTKPDNRGTVGAPFVGPIPHDLT